MPELQGILTSPWNETEVFAESIPHLLHWDLAYLWILQKQREHRPRNWETLIGSWRRLIQLFLLGELEQRPLKIGAQEILRRRLERIGFPQVVGLYFKDALAGVLSPTVLVRPLPDSNKSELRITEDSLEERRPEFTYFLNILIGRLEQGPTRYGSVVAKILRTEFPDSLRATHKPLGRSETIYLLEGIEWEEGQDRSLLRQATALVSAGGGPTDLYVPRCQTCNTLLTQEASQTVTVTGNVIPLVCTNLRCEQRQNAIALDNLLIWLRDRTRVMVWHDRVLPVYDEQLKFPPAPRINGREVTFTWNPALVDGEEKRNHLRLVFPERTIETVTIQDIFFQKIIVPGRPENFKGLPIRSEFWDALDAYGAIEVQNTGIMYRQLKLSGWPRPFDWNIPSLSITVDTKVAVGLYPPEMNEEWKVYRVFAVGENAKDYRIALPAGRLSSATYVETHEGWPAVISIEGKDRNAGTTWDFVTAKRQGQTTEPLPLDRQETRQNLFIGIDFGTSNTLAYFQRGSSDPTQRTSSQPIRPDSIKDIIEWVQQPVDDFIGRPWFLPRVPVSLADPFLIPSAVWKTSDLPFWPIRWTPEEPSLGSRAFHEFKWADAANDRDQARKNFLREVLFLSLPFALDKTELKKKKANVSLGLAYPLAFTNRLKKRVADTFIEIEEELESLTGLSFRDFSINESFACVRAFGVANPNETFLVADMGGGTIDVALFKYGTHGRAEEEAELIEHLGSLKFGGEIFVNSVSERKSRRDEEKEKRYWEFRDAVTRENVSNLYPEDEVIQTLADNFQVMALEYLRTMLAAYRIARPSEDVKVILVGNGWRICELANLRDARAPQQSFFNYFRTCTESFEIPKVSLRKIDNGQLPSSKHLVVLGALENARSGQRNGFREDAVPSKLPAGRSCKFVLADPPREYTVPWNKLVGQAVQEDYTASVLKGSRESSFDFESGPQPTPAWASRIDQAIPPRVRYPEEAEFRSKLWDSLANRSFIRGPLQIILEEHWVKHLAGEL